MLWGYDSGSPQSSVIRNLATDSYPPTPLPAKNASRAVARGLTRAWCALLQLHLSVLHLVH